MHNDTRCDAFVATHQVTGARDDLQIARAGQRRDPGLEFMAWRDLVILAREKEPWPLELAQITSQPEDGQADRYHSLDPWVMHGIGERHIRAKRVADQAELIRVGIGLIAGAFDGASDIKRFQSSIGLLSFAVADATKIEA